MSRFFKFIVGLALFTGLPSHIAFAASSPNAQPALNEPETLTLQSLTTFVECERQGSLGIGCPRVAPEQKPVKFVLAFVTQNAEGLDVYRSELELKKFRANKNDLHCKVALWKFQNPVTGSKSYRLISTFWGEDYFNTAKADFGDVTEFIKTQMDGNYFLDNGKIFYPTLILQAAAKQAPQK